MSEAQPVSGGGWREARRPASPGWDLISPPDPTMAGSGAGEWGRQCQPGLASAAPRPCPGWVGRHSYHLVAETHHGQARSCWRRRDFHAQFMDKVVEPMSTSSLVKILQYFLIVLRLGPSPFPRVLTLPTSRVPATLKYSQPLHSLCTLLLLALCMPPGLGC